MSDAEEIQKLRLAVGILDSKVSGLDEIRKVAFFGAAGAFFVFASVLFLIVLGPPPREAECRPAQIVGEA